MHRIENPLDGSVTYEISADRWVTFDARTIQRYGLAALLENEGVTLTERVPVVRHGKRVGTLPPNFDPLTARSWSFLYDVRPGDFRREGDTWVVSGSLGARDLDCIVGFVREHNG